MHDETLMLTIVLVAILLTNMIIVIVKYKSNPGPVRCPYQKQADKEYTQERRRILDMLVAHQITTEEAEKLLASLDIAAKK